MQSRRKSPQRRPVCFQPEEIAYNRHFVHIDMHDQHPIPASMPRNDAYLHEPVEQRFLVTCFLHKIPFHLVFSASPSLRSPASQSKSVAEIKKTAVLFDGGLKTLDRETSALFSESLFTIIYRLSINIYCFMMFFQRTRNTVQRPVPLSRSRCAAARWAMVDSRASRMGCLIKSSLALAPFAARAARRRRSW